MTLTKKIIIVVCLLSVLVSVFVISSGADGYVYASGVYTRSPVFAPDQILMYHSPNYVLIDTDLSIPVPINTGSSGNSARVDSDLVTTNSGLIVQKDISSTANAPTYNAYGYEYSNGSYYLDLYDISVSGSSSLAIIHNDIFIAPNLVSYDWNKIGKYSLTDYENLAPLSFSSCQLVVDYSYLSEYNGVTTYHEIDNKNIPITNAEAVDSSLWMPKLKQALMNGLQYRDYKNGFNIDSITLQFFGIYYDYGLSVRGSAWYEDLDDSGATRAVTEWSKYYGDRVNVVQGAPTLLESVSRGINSIMDMKVFGTWNIGQIFGACIGLALFTWFLKIFAGG